MKMWRLNDDKWRSLMFFNISNTPSIYIFYDIIFFVVRCGDINEKK